MEIVKDASRALALERDSRTLNANGSRPMEVFDRAVKLAINVATVFVGVGLACKGGRELLHPKNNNYNNNNYNNRRRR